MFKFGRFSFVAWSEAKILAEGGESRFRARSGEKQHRHFRRGELLKCGQSVFVQAKKLVVFECRIKTHNS